MRLLSLFFGLFFLSQLFNKGGKALFCILLKMVFMAKIKVISQPFYIILLRGRLHTSAANVALFTD